MNGVEHMERVEPAEAGFSADRLAWVGRFVAGEIAAERMPGAVLGIVRGGRLVHLEAYGYRDKARGIPMTTDSLFWIASMTKPVTTAGALLLVEQGRLVLESDVSEYLPEFADRRVADRPSTHRDRATADPGRRPATHSAGPAPAHRRYPGGAAGRFTRPQALRGAVGEGMTGLTGRIHRPDSRTPFLNQPGRSGTTAGGPTWPG